MINKSSKDDKTLSSRLSFFKRDKNNKDSIKNRYDSDERNKKNQSLFAKVRIWWPLSKISGRIFLIYLLVVLLGGFLLSIPGVLTKAGEQFNWDFLTGVFTASSAFSDTGINIVDPSHHYSFWGQLIILVLIEIGGIGVLTFKIVLFLAINKKISLNDTVVAQSERGSSTTSSTIEMIRDGFIWLTMVQIFAAAILFFAFFFSQPGTVSNNWMIDENGVATQTPMDVISPYHNFGKSLWFSIFHSTSAINNAGFDLISSNSLQPYNVEGSRSYLIQTVFLLEWVIGGLGYPTFHDIKRKIKARRTGQKVRFSLFTKLNFWIYLFLFVVGPLSMFGSEMANYDNSLIFHNYEYTLDSVTGQYSSVHIIGEKNFGAGLMDIFFNTTAARNSGFSTVKINDFNAGSKTIMSILMFIGSAPSSTAGGIRTTTFAIILLANWAIIRNRNYTSAFKKTIPERTVKRAFAVFFISAVAVALAIVIIYCDSAQYLTPGLDGDTPFKNGNNSIIEIFTLVTSAFGTVGMNPFTQQQMIAFGWLTKITLIISMFLGQLGISNTLLAFIKPSRKQPYQYLEEDVTIG
ncbi:TrkH family potassium uptake protein [[Acholeplasma] multilocale]|uniref:TrkH family potassium uptake protein n=1 Tax=[Acholeplasma] multilocale TaxID=264638 RepID=UPI000687AF4D|nr:potassium transporter TrkG [[Acholeplasma] multilocale]